MGGEGSVDLLESRFEGRESDFGRLPVGAETLEIRSVLLEEEGAVEGLDALGALGFSGIDDATDEFEVDGGSDLRGTGSEGRRGRKGTHRKEGDTRDRTPAGRIAPGGVGRS